jgi:hypothetical protein
MARRSLAPPDDGPADRLDLRWLRPLVRPVGTRMPPLPRTTRVHRQDGRPVTPPPYKPDLDAISWIEDPCHGPSRPRRLTCWLIFWRPCPHRLAYDRAYR